jgi:hypothetical protein
MAAKKKTSSKAKAAKDAQRDAVSDAAERRAATSSDGQFSTYSAGPVPNLVIQERGAPTPR